MSGARRLREMINGDGIHVAPGAFDGLTARLVEQGGFDLVYASGGAIARSFGVPDIGLLSFTEVTNRLAAMAEVTSLPILADADTGFGNEVNAVRTIQLYERIGMAGLHIEDTATLGKTFVVGMGCELRHARRLVYSDGLALGTDAAVTPIGMGCKVCERAACPQRAFPMIGRPLRVDENSSTLVPYVPLTK